MQRALVWALHGRLTHEIYKFKVSNLMLTDILCVEKEALATCAPAYRCLIYWNGQTQF